MTTDMFCTLLFNFVSYLFLLLIYFMYFYCYVLYSYFYACSVQGILFHCVVLWIICV